MKSRKTSTHHNSTTPQLPHSLHSAFRASRIPHSPHEGLPQTLPRQPHRVPLEPARAVPDHRVSGAVHRASSGGVHQPGQGRRRIGIAVDDPATRSARRSSRRSDEAPKGDANHDGRHRQRPKRKEPVLRTDIHVRRRARAARGPAPGTPRRRHLHPRRADARPPPPGARNGRELQRCRTSPTCQTTTTSAARSPRANSRPRTAATPLAPRQPAPASPGCADRPDHRPRAPRSFLLDPSLEDAPAHRASWARPRRRRRQPHRTPPLLDVKTESIQARELRTIDYLLPGILALSIMQLGSSPRRSRSWPCACRACSNA